MNNQDLQQINLKSLIRTVPDFPKPGIQFKDITPVLRNPMSFKSAIDQMTSPFDKTSVDTVVAIEARGYLLGAGIALKIGSGIVPVRKPNKLPWLTFEESYELEYGSETLQIHQDAIGKGDNVLLVDDVLATGGTLRATINLVERFGANIVGISLLAELTFLNGREQLKGLQAHSVISY